MDRAQFIFCVFVGLAFIALGAVVAAQNAAGIPVMVVGGGVLMAVAFTVIVNRQSERASMMPAHAE